MRKMVTVLAILVLMVTAAVAQVFLLGGSDAVSGAGPLKKSNATIYIERLQPGKRFTDARAILQLTGNRPAAIVSVEQFTSGTSFRYLGAYVAGADRKYGEGMSEPAWPPSRSVFGAAKPAVGYRILPESHTPPGAKGFELLLGYAMVGGELSFRTKIEVTYRVAGKMYRLEIPSVIVGCPESYSLTRCESARPVSE